MAWQSLSYPASSEDLKMYWCWDSTLERSNQRMAQSLDLSKTAELSNEHAGEMMSGSKMDGISFGFPHVFFDYMTGTM